MNERIVIAVVAVILGFVFILKPKYFVNMCIWIIEQNIEIARKQKGEPSSGYIPDNFKAWGINEKELSKPISRTQIWLVRILGFMFIAVAIMGVLKI
jgi:hypothetical protein